MYLNISPYNYCKSPVSVTGPERENMKSETSADSMKCSSCGVRIENQKNWVQFECPGCGKTKIIRCEKCRSLMNVYECSNCSFRGP